MTIYADVLNFVTMECCNCHIAFGVTQRFEKDRRADRKTFHCPQGHPQSYREGQSDESRLRQEVERQKELRDAEAARLDRVERERNQIAKAHMKMRARVMNGVCPCCNRTFQNLLRHMQTEHQGELTLKRFREAYGMTQSAIAKEIGVAQGYVSNHERGQYVPQHAKATIEHWVAAQEGAKA